MKAERETEPRTMETMRDGTSRETEMERGDDRDKESETEIRVQVME